MEQSDILRLLVEALERLNVPYMVVGSIASSSYGEPRMTLDIDVVADLQPVHIKDLEKIFASPDFYWSPEAALMAIAYRGQFNIIHASSGNKIDILLSKSDSYAKAQLSRRQRMEVLENLDGYLARPEDVIIGKMQYYMQGGSEKHLRDIAGILAAPSGKIDQTYIEHWSEILGLEEVWRAILARMKG